MGQRRWAPGGWGLCEALHYMPTPLVPVVRSATQCVHMDFEVKKIEAVQPTATGIVCNPECKEKQKSLS